MSDTKWIDAEKRKPKPCENVLVHWSKKEGFTGCTLVGFHEPDKDADRFGKGWWELHGEDSANLCPIAPSHWQPLPADP